jgi:hypothetical protein
MRHPHGRYVVPASTCIATPPEQSPCSRFVCAHRLAIASLHGACVRGSICSLAPSCSSTRLEADEGADGGAEASPASPLCPMITEARRGLTPRVARWATTQTFATATSSRWPRGAFGHWSTKRLRSRPPPDSRLGPSSPTGTPGSADAPNPSSDRYPHQQLALRLRQIELSWYLDEVRSARWAEIVPTARGEACSPRVRPRRM